ncbi:glycosyltransferase [Luteimonas sp. MJ174]|uniref:glycosyltransferase n=1 Tax=Luteimonas sp. MJ174 TaxID=3129237 RepID=UPI0031BB6224
MSNQSETIEISDPSALSAKPLVSVYMLAYRHEKFIADAIDSVIAQNCNFPIELIIGEDCSPDCTGEIVRDYQRRYPHFIRVLTSGQNVGAHANAARCRAACRGDYVAICEGDDYWCDPSKLTRQVDLLSMRPTCSLIYHSARIIDAISGSEIGLIGLPFGSCRLTVEDMILGDGGLFPTASVLVKRSVLMKSAEWARNAPVGDYPLGIKAALEGDVIYLDRVMSVYRANVPHSWTQRHHTTLAHRLTYANAIEDMLVQLQNYLGKPSWRPVQATISKYYSDIVVRIEGAGVERKSIYQQTKSKMHGSDRLLACLAAKFGVRLPGIKSAIRKSKTLMRVINTRLHRRENTGT